MRILLCRLLDHVEERRLHLLAVDDEHTAEYLVAAVLRVDLREAENLRVGQRAAELFLNLVQILYFLGRQRQTFLLVVFLKVVNVLDRLRLVVDGEDILVESVVHSLQHWVVVGIFAAYGEVFLYTRNAVQIHVLCNLNGIRTPGGYHLAARAYEISAEAVFFYECGIAIKPAQFLYFLIIELMVSFSSNNAL